MNIIKLRFLLPICCTLINPVQAQVKTIPYQQLPTSGGSPTGSNMYFGASMTSSSITITFEGPSNKWIAVGFGSFMSPTDAFIYSNGKSGAIHALGWNDYYISSNAIGGVNNDAIQNWTVVSNSVSAGQRTVVATRVLNTGDASDVIFNFGANNLNLVWARGATADYTIAYHGTTNRANNINLPWLTNPTASFAVNSSTPCAGSSVTFSNQSTGGQLSYTWNFQGASPATSTLANPIVTYTLPGSYSVGLVATNSLGTSSYTQSNYITVNPTVAPSVSITQISGQNPLCAGAAIGFSASVTNGGGSPGFQWKVNGINAGTNSSAFNTNLINTNSSVSCVLFSNAQCSSPSSVTSSAIQLTVNSTFPASVTVLQNIGSNPMCSGALCGFSASPGNGGQSPFYQWKLNGLSVGTNANTYTNNTLANNDQVSCELISSNSCASSTFALSNIITASVSNVLVPSLSLALVSGTNPACAGSSLSFSVITLNAGTSPVHNWKINGITVLSGPDTFSSSTLQNGDQLSCEHISSSSCASPSTATSNILTMSMIPLPPAPVISGSGSNTFCSGQSILLNSSASSGNIWSTGSFSNSIQVSSSGTFMVQQVLNGCISPPSAVYTTQVLPLPQINFSIFPILCLDDEALLLNQASPSGGQYSGQAVTNGSFFPLASGSGSSFVVYTYTDTNNCSARDSLSITVDLCTSIPAITANSNQEFSLFPNPVFEELNIESSQGLITRIEILDSKLCCLQVLDNPVPPVKIQFNNYSAGIYFVRIKTDSDFEKVLKVFR